jgi:hypothetical protein
VVEAPTGLAPPFSVAPPLVMLVAALVVTTGGDGMVNDRTVPTAVPEAFDTIAQK